MPEASRPRTNSALVASAARIRLAEKPKARRTQEWQNEAWRYFDEIGEVKFAMFYVANHLAKLRLFPALVPTDPRDPPMPDDESLGDMAIRALRGPSGGYGEILKEAAINLFVPGECYLTGQGSGDVDSDIAQWEIRSTDELEIGDGVYKLREAPFTQATELDDADMIVIRLWLRHARYSQLPDSPLRGVLSSCEEVARIERVIRGAARSRSAGPGLLLIPDEASFGNPDPTTESSGDGEALNDPFYRTLLDAMITPIQDEGSAASVVPLILRAPGDVLDKIRRVDLSIDIDTELIKLERALTRLAQGLPLPPEIITGKADLNHWTAWSVDEAAITAYVEPLAVPIVDALTDEYYRPFLIASGMDPDEAMRRQLWYDVTPLITRPNRSADADFGLDHISLSETAWRRIKGFPEEDAPTPVERLTRLISQRGSFDPVFTSVILRELGITDTDLPEVINQPPSPGPSSPPPAPRTGPPDDNRPTRVDRVAVTPSTFRSLVILPSNEPSGSDLGLRLADIDRDLRIRLHASADAAVRRALERANSIVISKLRNHSRYSAVLRGAPKLEAASRIGRAGLEVEGIHPTDLFADSFALLHSRFTDWADRTYARAQRIVGPLDLPDVSADINAAADFLVESLQVAAVNHLFDPNSATVEMFGESDETSIIDPGIGREALTRAGGRSPELESLGSGIATGLHVQQALARTGWAIDGWQWRYGSSVRSRDFEPHADLDGVHFSRWNSDVLANRGTWPAVSFYTPGDHPQCSCDAVPLLVRAEEIADEA